MGASFPFGAGSSAEPSGTEETEEEGGDDDESIVHHTASVGDEEVMRTLVWMFGVYFCFELFWTFHIYLYYMLLTLQIYFINVHYYLLVFAIYLLNLSDATGT